MKKQKSENWKDIGLLEELAALKEEVAAPSHFRRQILEKLALERGLSKAPKAPSLWEKLGRALSRPSFLASFAASVALLLGLAWSVLHFQKTSALPANAVAVAAMPLKSPAATQMAALPAKAKGLRHKAEAPRALAVLPQSVSVEGGEQSSAVLPMGAQAPLSASVQSNFSGQNPPSPLSESPLPAAPNASEGLKPEPQPQTSPSYTQIRRNKIRPNEGEYSELVFKLQNAGNVNVQIFNRAGRLVNTLSDSYFGAGESSLQWDGRDGSGQLCPSGIYFLRIVTPEYVETQKVVVIN